MDIKLPTSFEELIDDLSEQETPIFDEVKEELTELQQQLDKPKEDSIFAHIQFKKNRKTPTEYDEDFYAFNSLPRDFLIEIWWLLCPLRDKDGNITIKDISEGQKIKIINSANWYLKEAINRLSDLNDHIENNPQEHYLGTSLEELSQIEKLRSKLITYLYLKPQFKKYCRYLCIATC